MTNWTLSSSMVNPSPQPDAGPEHQGHSGAWEMLGNGFQGIFGIYTSWLLLCIRIPPEKDGENSGEVGWPWREVARHVARCGQHELRRSLQIHNSNFGKCRGGQWPRAVITSIVEIFRQMVGTIFRKPAD